MRAWETPAAPTSTSLSALVGSLTATSAEMKPPIELPTKGARSIPRARQSLLTIAP